VVSWNVLVRPGGGLTLVDWEDAQEHGPPLWDLSFFLTDALARLDGVRSDAQQDEHSRLLWRGELPSSAHLFGWLRRAAGELDLPAGAVGPLVTLLWLSVGLDHLAHLEAAERSSPGSLGAGLPMLRLAQTWLRDDGLGPSWHGWEQS
jgi:hypothetical protein